MVTKLTHVNELTGEEISESEARKMRFEAGMMFNNPYISRRIFVPDADDPYPDNPKVVTVAGGGDPPPSLGAITAEEIKAIMITGAHIATGAMRTGPINQLVTKEEAEKMAEQREETVREAISRRVIDASIKFGKRVNKGSDPKELLFGFATMYEAVLPFLTPDTKVAMTGFLKEFEQEARNADNQEILKNRASAEIDNTTDDAW